MLTPPQQAVVDAGLLESGFNCVLQMATGAGKTWLAEQAMAKTLARGHRAIYLTPIRALASELVHRWQAAFSSHSVGIFTGDYGRPGAPLPVPFARANLMVMTPERLDACTRAWRSHWTWLPEVDLLVVDEAHLLGDRQRGARLEGTISRFRRLNPFARVLALSATMGNRSEIADWLGGVEFASDWRPIPLTWKVARFRKASDKPEILATEVARVTKQGGKSLVFVQSRRRAEYLSGQLNGSGLKARHHHAGLGHRERSAVETAFRESGLDVLVATPTLEVGVNLPVRQVVLYDLQKFDGSDYSALDVNTVWQRVGRAGRPGLDTEGEAVLLAPSWDGQAKHYERGRFESIRSGLADRRALAEQIVAEVASGLCRTRRELKRTLVTSLGHHQGTLPPVDQVVEEMCTAQMLTERVLDDRPAAGLRLKATRLGRIATRHLLSPATVSLFVRGISQRPMLTNLDLLLLLASCEDCEPTLPVDFEELDALADRLRRQRSYFLAEPSPEIAMPFEATGKRLLSAVKMALVAEAWTEQGDAATVADEFDCYPFEVERLRDSLLRLLPALVAVVTHVHEQNTEEASDAPQCDSLKARVTTLMHMLAAGLDETSASLAWVAGIGPKLAKRLCDAGIEDLEDLAQAEVAVLSALPGISASRAGQWIEAADALLPAYAESIGFPGGPLVEPTDTAWPADVEPYRLRRALDLKVVVRGARTHVVTGGTDPHIVRQTADGPRCDCPDAAKGHTCKHVMAVLLYQEDGELLRLADALAEREPARGLRLFDLWFESPAPRRRQ